MAKSQYKFNPEDINFKEVDKSLKFRLWRTVAYVLGILFTALILNIIFILLFDSPKERAERRENEFIKDQLEQIKEKKATVDTVFEEISEKNENIFRLIFETEPAESNIADLESEPYERLKNMSDEEIVNATANRLDSLLDRARKNQLDYDILWIKSEDKADMLSNLPSIQPIENEDLSRTASGYGFRLHPIYKILKMHQGIDYAAPVGTPVIATGSGVVSDVIRTNRGNGNRVVIDHGYGVKTVYAHLSKINTRRGRKVERGEVIGEVGTSGQSAGPHLHYEVLMNGSQVNPVNFYFMELSPEKYDEIITISKNSGQSFD